MTTPRERVEALASTGPFLARTGQEEADWAWLLAVARSAVAWREKHPTPSGLGFKWAGTTADLIAAVDGDGKGAGG